MIESKCPTCGGKKLDPDPPPKSKDENIQFRKDWDAQYVLGQIPSEDVLLEVFDSVEDEELEDDDRPCLWCLEPACRGGCLL